MVLLVGKKCEAHFIGAPHYDKHIILQYRKQQLGYERVCQTVPR